MKGIKSESGIALVIALMVLLVMTALGTAVFYNSTVDFKIAGNERTGMVAYYAALAGLRQVGQEIAADHPDMRGTLNDTTWNRTVTGTLPNGSSYSVNISYLAFANGPGYDVRKDGGAAANGYPNCTGAGYIGYPVYRVTATGTYGNSNRVIEELGCLKFVSPFSEAITTCGDLSIESASKTDSYDSDTGTYGGGNVGTEGDIVTSGNVTVKGNTTNFSGSVSTPMGITLQQGADVTGSAHAGVTVAIESNQSTITGSVTSADDINNQGTVNGSCTYQGSFSGNDCGGGKVQNSVTAPEAPEACLPDNWLKVPDTITTVNDNSGMVCKNNAGNPIACQSGCTDGSALCTISSNTSLTLPGGPDKDNPKRYYFKGLTVSQNAKIVTTGFVRVYIEGDFKTNSNDLICGNIALADCKDNPLPNSDPEQVYLHIYGQSNSNPGVTSTIDINSNTRIWGKIYAPAASMTVVDSQSHVYGSMLAGGMCSGCGTGGGVDANSGVHYDIDIQRDNTVAQWLKLVSRKECFYGTYSSFAYVDSEGYGPGACKPR